MLYRQWHYWEIAQKVIFLTFGLAIVSWRCETGVMKSVKFIKCRNDKYFN